MKAKLFICLTVFSFLFAFIGAKDVKSQAFAGVDQVVCEGNTQMSAATPLDGNGLWTILSGNGTILGNTSAQTTINNLDEGDNVFQWTVTDLSQNQTSDIVVITYKSGAVDALKPKGKFIARIKLALVKIFDSHLLNGRNVKVFNQVA